MYYLKWLDDIVGVIDGDFNLKFTDANYNKLTKILSGGKGGLTRNEFAAFLADRVISRDRRDIDRVLFRLGLSGYDVFKIAVKTYAINPKDLFWITENKNEKMVDALGGSFEDIFKQAINGNGFTNSSPDGQNIKEYFISDGDFGIKKQRLHGLSTDAENEAAAYKLGLLLGVNICEARMLDGSSVFSKYEYDFTCEFLVHARNYFKDGEQSGHLYRDLVKKFPKLKAEIQKMLLFDFITRQEDRHLSNFAVIETPSDSRFYSLYDNGRCLFYSEPEEFVKAAAADIETYSTSFGEIGTYFDIVNDIKKETDIKNLINLDISENVIAEALTSAGLTGYRLDGAVKWIRECIGIL
jgi:hypothetical protein